MNPRHRLDHMNQIKACNKRHHTLLHTDRREQSADKREATSSHNSTVNDRNATEASCYCLFKNKPTTQVLLATAVVEVRNKYNQYVQYRVLLDSASQVSFITERCVQRLRLIRNQTVTSVQEINTVNTACPFTFDQEEPTGTHPSCVQFCQTITSNSPATRLDITKWNIPKNIPLADEHFDKPSAIDLLIGADLFYEILQSNKRTREGHPVL
jgi:hypothetical protein